MAREHFPERDTAIPFTEQGGMCRRDFLRITRDITVSTGIGALLGCRESPSEETPAHEEEYRQVAAEIRAIIAAMETGQQKKADWYAQTKRADQGVQLEATRLLFLEASFHMEHISPDRQAFHTDFENLYFEIQEYAYMRNMAWMSHAASILENAANEQILPEHIALELIECLCWARLYLSFMSSEYQPAFERFEKLSLRRINRPDGDIMNWYFMNIAEELRTLLDMMEEEHMKEHPYARATENRLDYLSETLRAVHDESNTAEYKELMQLVDASQDNWDWGKIASMSSIALTAILMVLGTRRRMHRHRQQQQKIAREEVPPRRDPSDWWPFD